MQRHVDIYRHKVIMGMHNKSRQGKMMDGMQGTYSDGKNGNFSSMEDELEQMNMNEIAIDDPN